MKTANRLNRHGKRAFFLLAVLTLAAPAQAKDAGWRLTLIPSFETIPPVTVEIPGAHATRLAVAREAEAGELEYATTLGALRYARDQAAQHGQEWMAAAKVVERRDKDNLITRVLITADNPLLPALAISPALYDHYEPLLGHGFYVVIPDRGTIALYPRLAGAGIPPREAAALLEFNRLATYPVSREVFQASRAGLTAVGTLEEE